MHQFKHQNKNSSTVNLYVNEINKQPSTPSQSFTNLFIKHTHDTYMYGSKSTW